jgi:hypothetical protein
MGMNVEVTDGHDLILTSMNSFFNIGNSLWVQIWRFFIYCVSLVVKEMQHSKTLQWLSKRSVGTGVSFQPLSRPQSLLIVAYNEQNDLDDARARAKYLWAMNWTVL